MALFLADKRIEGCSEKSLKYYQATTQAMLDGTSIHLLSSILVSYRALSRLANSFCSISDFSFFRVIKKADRFLISICLAYLIFTFREFKSIHKGKTAILHLRFGTEKNRRLGSKKARYNRAFRRRHLFCLHIMARPKGFEPPFFRIGICCVIQLRHRRIFGTVFTVPL